MRETQLKGDRAKAKALSSFTELGYDVAILLTESAAYDLIVDFEGQLKKVQVKFISTEAVDLRNIHVNTKGRVVKLPREASYDWLYVLTACGLEYLITENLAGRTSIKPRPEHQLGNSISQLKLRNRNQTGD